MIFRSARCYEKFIELLSSLPERFGVRLHGYALMGNHYHLQLESREANLSKALKRAANVSEQPITREKGFKTERD